ncbi:hypothetical protein V8E51_009597 [Hyaloscypha variabilis]
MCDHRDCHLLTNNDPRGYCDRDHCDIYYVHQHGMVYCHPNVQFRDSAAENSSRDVGSDVAASFCGDDRLTLMHLPSIPDFRSLSSKGEGESERIGKPEFLADILPANMPTFFREKLKKICEHCECKPNILWSNFRRQEQHFDACFRYVNREETLQQKCFLEFYTLRVPFLSEPTVSFSMVHHIRAEEGNFVPASADTTNEDNNQEHMFGFISGLDGMQMQALLTSLVFRWQDIVNDHSSPSTGITPQLFVAALISQYGSIISGRLRKVYMDARICSYELQKLVHNLDKEEELDPSLDQAHRIGSINQNLIDMTIRLTGTKSTMHYLAESADVTMTYIMPFEQYVEARLNEWHTTSERTRLQGKVTDPKEPDLDLKRKRATTFNNKLLGALQRLDSSREKMRDHDELVIVRKNMLQYKTDIESLQQHINIHFDMVSNVAAARDRSIQESIMANTARDGAKMKFMAILTAFFLPGTFMAVFLTTPMFNFLDDTKPLLTKQGIPLGIYWFVTVVGFVVLLIVLFLLHNPVVVCWFIDNVIPLKIIRHGSFYQDCKKQSSKLTLPKVDRKNRGNTHV